MKAVLMFDIDGTILDGNRQILDSTVRSIRKARDKGAYAVINTGRSRGIIPQNVIDIGFDGMICGCGSYVEWQGEVIQNHTISPDLLRKADGLFSNPGIFTAYEGPRQLYYKMGGRSPYLVKFLEKWLKDDVFSKALPFTEEAEEINKFTVFFEHPDRMDPVAADLAEDMYAIRHGDHYLEFILNGFSKASHFGDFLRDIPDCGKIYAFGDSMNDKAMIEEADIGVAMGNANEDLKVVADHVTGDIHAGGLTEALMHFGLID